jgi:hypothetical protein
LEVELAWHPRDAAEPGYVWLRDVVSGVFGTGAA